MSQTEFEGETTMSLIQQVATMTYQMCPAYTYEEIARDYLFKAGNLFAEGKDEKAKWFRDEAKSLEDRAKSHRAKEHKTAAEKRERLIAELEERIIGDDGQEKV